MSNRPRFWAAVRCVSPGVVDPRNPHRQQTSVIRWLAVNNQRVCWTSTFSHLVLRPLARLEDKDSLLAHPLVKKLGPNDMVTVEVFTLDEWHDKEITKNEANT